MARLAFIMTIVSAHILCAQAPRPSAATAAADASTLLTHARDKILNSIRRLPKYTCLETIDRTYYVAPREKRSANAMSEDQATSCMGNRAGRLSMDAKDRLRVEVAAAGEGEIHSWPGANHFDTRSFDQMIPFGPISTGAFGTSLLDVFANPGAEFRFIGKKAEGAREVFEYSFRVPLNASHVNVMAVHGWQVAEYGGSFEVNAATAELARLVIDTDSLPPDSGMCRTKTTIDYRFMLIGDGEFLIPRRSEFQTFDTDASQTDSATTFSACHEYTAESSIRFDGQSTSAIETANTPKLTAALPSGLSLPLTLIGLIDARSAAAGDQVSAKVTKPVRAPGTGEILVPAGAIARGRILQMRHQYNSSQFLMSIRFDSLEIHGVVSTLSVRLDRELKPDKPRNTQGLQTRGSGFSLPPSGSTETGSLLVFPAGNGASSILDGFQSKWITVAP